MLREAILGGVVVAWLLAGCVDMPVEEAASETAQAAGTSPTPPPPPPGTIIDGCPRDVCGSNSPEMDNYGFHMVFKTLGVQNPQGFALSGFNDIDGHPWRLDVAGGRIIGRSPVWWNPVVLQGQALVGAQLWITRTPLGQGPLSPSPSPPLSVLMIRIAEVSSIPFPVGPAGTVETYVLEYAPVTSNGAPNNEWKNICGGETSSGTSGDGPDPELLGMRARETVVFEYDNIDLATMTTKATGHPDAVNFGCAGHTLAKLYLTRNTIASNAAATWEERQATLKLLTADYCGNGTPFTVAGQRLTWQGGYVSYYEPMQTLEALWDQDGATCLAIPRLKVPSTPEGDARYGSDAELEEAILNACLAAGKERPRKCTKSDLIAPALRVSGNPPLPQP